MTTYREKLEKLGWLDLDGRKQVIDELVADWRTFQRLNKHCDEMHDCCAHDDVPPCGKCDNCLRVQAIERAEAAEKRVAELEAQVAKLTGKLGDDLLRAHRAEKRIAELTAQLQAHADCREVTVNARIAELEAALRDLSFHAQTSGGVAGRDDALCLAIDRAHEALERKP